MFRLRYPTSFLCLLLAVVLQTCACAGRHVAAAPGQPAFAERVQIGGISDAGKINDFLYRGTQPKEEGIEALKKLGIDTIVDLRSERRGTIATEKKRAESQGMRLVSIPAGNGWSTPRDEQIAQFFSLVQEKPKRTIYIHCWLGGDRSGTFLAAYRIAFDGWTPEQAIAEMRAFHYHEFWHPGMRTYVLDFPARLARSPELAPYRNENPEEVR
jgi:protein tyrosine phosphatase (PTP) superfamily phosphohydrolase (DUF442 family)